MGSNGPGGLPTELIRFLETYELPPGEHLAGFLGRYDELMNGVSVPIPEPDKVVIREVDGWRVRAAIWGGKSEVARPVVLHLHGGGWVVGNHLTHRGLAAELVAAGFLVVSLDYRRAPKHRFPAALEDCTAALNWCHEHIERYGGDSQRIAVAGDSAGANLAAAVLVEDEGKAAKVGVLLCGIYEYHNALLTLVNVLGGGTAESQAYLRADEFESLRGDPRVSPLYAAGKLPCTYLGVGGRDPLVAESRRLQAALEADGRPHLYQEFPDGPPLVHPTPRSPLLRERNRRHRQLPA